MSFVLVNNRRFLQVTLVGLLILVGFSAIFIYQISPLRDPTFQPSATAGTLVPWLSKVRERDWIRAATILAVLLASNLTAVFYQFSQQRLALRQFGQARQAARILLWATIWLINFGFLWLGFIGYLLSQWLID